jgi:CDP-diacylglycerol---glycerol-3-phosphate 3-phosphatidyltransferase
MTIPNILTLFRIALIPVIVVLFFMPAQWTYMASAVVFATAAFTDLFDGYVARVTGQTSALGAFLDPVADKLMVAIALTLLVQMHNTIWLTIPAIFIIGRELAVSALREWMGKYGTAGDVGVAFLGKVKTTLQMIAITGLLANPPGIHDWPYYLSYAFLYVSFLLTAWSLYEYLVKAWPDLTDGRAE